jgi:uncharacterized NAD(P)/FAD-binding protein YdhS/tetratricopeptide (TPR) repeat protein
MGPHVSIGNSVAIVGAGAAGTLVAAQLARQAAAGPHPLQMVLFDPQARTADGVAYSTRDPRHRLNVSAGRISAWPDREDDFLRWLTRHAPEHAYPAAFAPRMLYGDYLRDVLDESVAAADGSVTLERETHEVTGLVPLGRRWRVQVGRDRTRYVDAVVLALGSGTPDDRWAPQELRHSPRFFADPWAPGAAERLADVEGDVLLVGTGLTMVDLATSLGRPGRVVHAVSRHGLLPAAHREDLVAPVPAPDLPEGELSLSDLTRAVRDHVDRTARATGDWRPAIDGLRPLNSTLWQRLSPQDQQQFLATTARHWEVRRHRMAAPVARRIAALRQDGRLAVRRGEVAGCIESGTGLKVMLADGSQLEVAAVVNCTGPRDDVRRRDSALLLDLLTSDHARPGRLGLGLATDGHGRLVRADGQPQAGLWTLGALRRGELYESTAIPEIRAQARDLASAVVAELPTPQVRRRPRDRYGLAVSASPEAAIAYGTALEALLRVQSGAEISLQHAATVDPGFALAHAGLALLGHEWGAAVDVEQSLTAAVEAVRTRGDERERSFVAAVEARIRRPGPEASAQLLTHIRRYGEDALAVSIAVPTIAFGGATEVPQEAWSLVEGLAPAYGSDWWYAGMLAFIRQEQERWDEAAELSERALAEVPSSGHAVHARAHVYYETGDHDAGLRWLDGWIDTQAHTTQYCAHFSWHAALHELALDDAAAVRRRYDTQLAPPGVSGPRALVDAASMLWRSRLTGAWRDDLPIAEVLSTVPSCLLDHPATPFAAMHAAVALAAAGDVAGLHRLRTFAADYADPTYQDLIVPLCDGFSAQVQGQPGVAAEKLAAVVPQAHRLGGSAAQQEIIAETLLHALVESGQQEAARELLQERLDRRPSRCDQRRLATLGVS